MNQHVQATSASACFFFFLGGGVDSVRFLLIFHRQATVYFASLPRCFRLPLIFIEIKQFRGRDSSVGTATRYGLDGPGTESR